MTQNLECKKLKDVCIIRPPKKEAKEQLSENELVSFVPMVDLGINQKFVDLNEERELSKVYSGYTYFKENDVLLAKITPCFENGKLGIAKNLTNGVGFGSSEYIVYRPKKMNELDSEYLYYFLSQKSFREFGTSRMTGAVGHKRIPKDFYEDYLIPILNIEEQKQIVEILDKAFESIEQAKANIEKNIQNSKDLFKNRLNEIFSQKSDDCKEKTLGEVCNLFQGLAINKKTKHLLVEKSSLPLLRIKDLKKNTEEQYVSEEGYPENSRVYKNEIIYTRTGSLGLVFKGREGILHNNSFKIIPNDELENDYLFWWLQHEEFTNKIIKLASKAAQPDITHKLFKEQTIIIPSKDKQKEYYLEIVKLDKLTKQLEKQYQQKLDNLEELKKSILQKAFSGELIP